MALSEARRRANEKYIAKAYEDIKLRVKKGEKETIKTYAESQGMSLNGYINKVIKEDMEKNSGK